MRGPEPEDPQPRTLSRISAPLKKGLPYLLFAAITLAVFWKFLFLGHSIYALVVLENQLGRPPQEPRWWFRPEKNPHVRVADNIVLLPVQFRIYNEGLKAGELRLWNPYLLCGYPIYADPMVHPFYPPHLLLHRLFAPEPAYELSLMLHLFFSGAAMFWLLGGLGRSRAAAAAGGAVWMLFGYNALWFSTGILAGVSVFGPLALLGLVRGFARKDLSCAAWAAVAMGMAILGSHPQHALNLFFFLLAWLGVTAARDREALRFTARFATVFGLLSVGVGLAAILTRLDTLANGWRSPGGDIESLYADPFLLISHLLGLALGKVYYPENPFVQYEFPVYAGLAGLTLALAGAVRSFRDPRVRFLAVFGACGLAVAFLRPLAGLLQYVPFLNLSPAARWIFVSGFCLAVLSGYGWDALRERIGRIPLVLAVVTATFVVVCAIGMEPFRFPNGGAIDTAIGFGLATAAACAALRWRPAALLLGFASLLYELLIPFLLTNWHVDSAVLRETPPAVRFVQEREKEPWRGTGLLGSIDPSGQLVLSELIDGNNLLAIFAVENVTGFEAVIPAHYFQYGRSAGWLLNPAGRAVHFATFNSRLLDAAGLKYLFLPPALQPHARFHLLKDFGRIKVWENSQVLPRAYLVSRVLTARDENEAIRLIRAPTFDPRESVILETQGATPAGGGSAEGRVEWTERLPDRVALRVTAKEPAILVVTDTDYPGWEAEIDGRAAPIYRANVAFRAVEIPAGEHAVRFRFRPDSVRTGLMGSILFLALAVAYAAGRRLRRK